MTIAEAMARGCAVVVPAQGPFTEFVEDKVHGRVYTLGSIDEAADRIQSLFEDDLFRQDCGRRGRAWILEKHASSAALQVLSLELKQILK